MDATYKNSLYGELLYGDWSGISREERISRWVTRCMRAIPREHKTADNFAVIEALVTPLAETLAGADATLDALPRFFLPETAPPDFLDWIIAEFFGWTLVPADYPLVRRRRLLQNLAAHYQRRSKPEGIRLLLAEFGVIASVFDEPLFVDDFIGAIGVNGPLRTLVQVYYFEPWELPNDCYVDGFIDGIFVYETTPLVTAEFAMKLVEWSRPAATSIVVEFVTTRKNLTVEALIIDQLGFIDITDPMINEDVTFEVPTA